MAQQPRVSVVVATRNRPERLEGLLRSLYAQTLPRAQFELVLVDDASTLPGAGRVLADAEAQPGVRIIRRPHPAGPATARNEGWRAASGSLIAFTDDDCVAAPEWLEQLLAAADGHPGAIIQGRTDPIPEEEHLRSPFSRTVVVHELGPPFETCNVVYPRAVLEAIGGFDETFERPVGEDTDLAWRATETGAGAVFVQDARVYHAVVQLGPLGMLRDVLRWTDATRMYAKHPGLRRAHLHHGVFWSPTHLQLLRFALAVPLVRRAPVVSLLLAWPYLVRLMKRRTGPLLAPYLLVYDLVEMYAIVRGAIRDRVLVL